MQLVIGSSVFAQVYPTGFSQVQVTNGLVNPVTMAFAPDGRIFVAQQNGQLRVIKNSVLLSQPFVSLNVNSSGERGLLGIAFDPNFTTNNYIYLYYTLSSGNNNRISRFTANGDVAQSGSEVVILNLDPLSSATNHNGGNMQFGPDGKLYIGTGENANTDWAQDLDSYLGKILRINADGSVPAGNPYTSGTEQRKRVWCLGLRNPFTIAFQPGTGRLFVNDVGQVDWEEINDATSSGKNFGWAWTEGNSTNPAYTNPIYTYKHREAGGIGCAITGGTFFNPTTTNYPSTYNGQYFYIDYCSNWINVLTINGNSASSSGFATNIAGSPVCIMTGTDGNLYFLSRDNSAIYKITYTGSSTPVITQQPQSISVASGNTASFSVSATGAAPLSYQWKKSGANISGSTSAVYTIPAVTTANEGSYSVVVSNSSGLVVSNSANLTVTASNQNPVATISTPAVGTTYTAGTTINFSGSGGDAEDGSLGAAALNWYVIFHHDTHTHPGPSVNSNGTSGSFTIPNIGETSANVWYRLYLVVTDSQGAKDTAYRDILPKTAYITFKSNPAGLMITLDGQPFTTPYTVLSVVGNLRAIGAVSPQTLNGINYAFSSWSQGGSQSQTLTSPVGNTTYTVTFTQSTNANTPYGGTARPIPGTIQAEDFDNGGQNVAYYDNSPGNLGGAYRTNESVDIQNSTEAVANIGWTEPGEWLKYTVNVTSTGVYTLNVRVASLNSSSSFRVEMDGNIIATFTSPNTGGYQAWQTVSKADIYLTAGTKVMRIYELTGGFNINYVSFVATTVSNYPPVANAGPDQTITLPSSTVTVTGTGTDSDGTISSYLWSKISGPAGGNITNASNATTTITALQQGVYLYQLKITDNNGATGTDQVQITVNAATSSGPKMINVNIYGTNVYSNSQWNNWKPSANTTSSNFKYSDGTASTVNAILTKQVSINDNGSNYAAGSTSCPPAVLQYYSASTQSRNLNISGLNPSKLYTLKFYASSTITSNGTTYYVNGFGSDDIITNNNVNNYAQLVNLIPTSAGKISVVLVSINTYNFLAGFNIIEQVGTVASRLTATYAKIEDNCLSPETGEEQAVSKVFPNPFNDIIHLRMDAATQGSYMVTLTDIKGIKLFTKEIRQSKGILSEDINTSRLARGIYTLQVAGPGNKRWVYKLFKY